jgi:starch phosphorylase
MKTASIPTLPAASARVVAAFRQAVQRELAQRSDGTAPEALLWAAAQASRGLLADRWARTQAADRADRKSRRVHYLSMEFLMGRALGNALAALGLDDRCGAAARDGLAAVRSARSARSTRRWATAAWATGRLLPRLPSPRRAMPSFGYGLRYQYGMFAQRSQDGRQVEVPDDWLARQPWEIARPELRYMVGFGGRVQADGDWPRWTAGRAMWRRRSTSSCPATAPSSVSTLRQWHATSEHPIDFAGLLPWRHGAARANAWPPTLNWVLYPDDSTHAGREMRLKQEFLLVSASLQDMLARHLREGGRMRGLRPAQHRAPERYAPGAGAGRADAAAGGRARPGPHDRLAHHPAGAVLHQPHAAARGAGDLAGGAVRAPAAAPPGNRSTRSTSASSRSAPAQPGDEALVQRLSLIDEAHGRRVRMAALAIARLAQDQRRAALHSQLMTETIFADYARLYPQRFFNVTNGVTPRRWLHAGQSGDCRRCSTAPRHRLAARRCQLQALRPLAGDAALQSEFLKASSAPTSSGWPRWSGATSA